jgi:hypothetical protein
MWHKKQATKRMRRGKAVPVLGLAGLSLSLASGASASTSGPAPDVQAQTTSPRHEIFLGEEEITDVSLSTFYVFDKENAKPQLGEKLAMRGCGGCRCGGCRCGGCGRGCRGCFGCRGCGGCGGGCCRC